MNVAVIVLTWNGAEHLPGCLESLAAQRGGDFELLIVDNGSADESIAVARHYAPEARIVENGRNLGFAGGMNVGIRLLCAIQQPPDVIVLLNQDTAVAPDWLERLTRPFAEDPQLGAAGCKIFYPDGQTLQHCGGMLDPARATSRLIGNGEQDSGQHNQPRQVDYVTGAAIALRTTALARVGLFDEGYNPAYYEEVDLCWRLRRAGYTVRYLPDAVLRHVESTSIRDLVQRGVLANRNRLRFVVKTFPSEQIWPVFLVAEQARLAAISNGPEARILRRVYLEGLLRCEEWIAARAGLYPVSALETDLLRGLFGELRRAMTAYDVQRLW